MALLGALNGTKVLIRVLDTTAGEYRFVYGEMSNSATLNNAPIDITNKYSNSFRELLAGEGLQSLDLTAEIIFNDADGFNFLRKAYQDKTINTYQIVKDGITGTIDQINMMIVSWAETSPNEDKTTVSVTFNSSSEFEQDLTFEELFATTDGQLFTANNEPLYVRV